jgi:hypothetical protein
MDLTPDDLERLRQHMQTLPEDNKEAGEQG